MFSLHHSSECLHDLDFRTVSSATFYPLVNYHTKGKKKLLRDNKQISGHHIEGIFIFLLFFFFLSFLPLSDELPAVECDELDFFDT